MNNENPKMPTTIWQQYTKGITYLQNKGLIDEIFNISHLYNSDNVSVSLEINPNNLT